MSSESTATPTRELDATGGASAYANGGNVRVELWCKDRAPGAGPIIVIMTPGQALGLCSNLASSSAVALREGLKP